MRDRKSVVISISFFSRLVPPVVLTFSVVATFRFSTECLPSPPGQTSSLPTALEVLAVWTDYWPLGFTRGNVRCPNNNTATRNVHMSLVQKLEKDTSLILPQRQDQWAGKIVAEESVWGEDVQEVHGNLTYIHDLQYRWAETKVKVSIPHPACAQFDIRHRYYPPLRPFCSKFECYFKVICCFCLSTFLLVNKLLLIKWYLIIFFKTNF